MTRVDSKLLRFCFVGAIGFLVDSCVLLILTKLLEFGYIFGRILSFLMACSVTWVLNRAFTFRSQSGLVSLFFYMLATSVGALINLATYKLVIDQMGTNVSDLILGVSIGSVIALGFNYTVCRWYVFR